MAGTRWVKIDTRYLSNPKISSITGAPGVLLHLASILWTADQLTDGYIPTTTLPELSVAARVPTTAAAMRQRAAEMVERGLWIPNGDGWHLHDFEHMNRQAMRAVVEKQRQAWRDKKAE